MTEPTTTDPLDELMARLEAASPTSGRLRTASAAATTGLAVVVIGAALPWRERFPSTSAEIAAVSIGWEAVPWVPVAALLAIVAVLVAQARHGWAWMGVPILAAAVVDGLWAASAIVVDDDAGFRGSQAVAGAGPWVTVVGAVLAGGSAIAIHMLASGRRRPDAGSIDRTVRLLRASMPEEPNG